MSEAIDNAEQLRAAIEAEVKARDTLLAAESWRGFCQIKRDVARGAAPSFIQIVLRNRMAKFDVVDSTSALGRLNLCACEGISVVAYVTDEIEFDTVRARP